MIRLSLTVTFVSAAIGMTMLGVTALPRPKPVGDEIPAPVVYAPVVAVETPVEPQAVKLEQLEDRLRAIQTKLTRIEGKAASEGQ